MLPKSEVRLTPVTFGDLRGGYEELGLPAKGTAEIRLLERRLTGLVNHAYRLTEEEIELPRMLGV